MRYLVLILSVVLCVGVASGQLTSNHENYLHKDMDASSAAIQNVAYGTADTTEWIYLTPYEEVYLSVQSKDSATILIKYQLSVDRVALGTLTTIDSLQTTSNAGNLKTINVLTVAGGAPYVRYVLAKSALAFPLGTSTATYSAVVTKKRY